LAQYTIIHLSETASTNSYAIELIDKKRPTNFCIIRSDFQTKGRGQDTNTWESEKGKNLIFSIILFPPFGAEHQFILNKAISLGIWDYLKKELSTQSISIKWPNDIYVGDKKICGILIQNSIMGTKLEYVVAGIGLNVNQALFKSDAPNPVSMTLASGAEYDLDEVLDNLLQFIFRRYEQTLNSSSADIEIDYHSALYRLMKWDNYIIGNNAVFARITGTNPYGQLMLESETKEIFVCDLKEVKFCF
jgi:BirA family biotin operon repressor/biotin-[acetyl-CoA-carboxylase] ligase